ncbi:MAG: alanine/glycine:cation symporter family protein [Candidatus Hydrogenedentota bacterium]
MNRMRFAWMSLVAVGGVFIAGALLFTARAQAPHPEAKTEDTAPTTTAQPKTYSDEVQAVADVQEQVDALFAWVVENVLAPTLFYSVAVQEDARPVFTFDTAASQVLWDVTRGGMSGRLAAPPELVAPAAAPHFLLDTRDAATGGDGGPEVVGVVESPPFVVDSDRINVLLAGGADKRRLYVEIVPAAGEKVGRSTKFPRATGPGSDAFSLVALDTSEHKGRTVHLRIVDDAPKGERAYLAVAGVYSAFTGIPLIILVLVGGGLFFTVRYGFVNIRLFRHAIAVVRGHYDDPRDKGEISHFQALTSALAATVGLGNIAGVAVAITAGGPGAVFWMWLTAILGMSLKFSSCTLAQVYRIFKEDGHVLGGPMVFLRLGIRDRAPRFAWIGAVFSPLFAVLTIFAAFGGGNMFQTNQTYNAVNEIFQLQEHPVAKPAIGLMMAILVGIVIIGGIKRIGEVTSKLVPAMCVGYITICTIIVFANYESVPGLLRNIVAQAFTGPAIFGGFMGVLIQGMKRAAFSNEAGLGSAAIAHAAAKTEEPIREGLVAMLGPFIDTIIVCTMTALAILATGVHNDAGGMQGVSITAQAFSTTHTAFPYFLAIAVFVFAYSTLLSWSYYGERAVEYLFGARGIGPYRTTYVLVAILGPLLSLNYVVVFADMMLLSMAFPNILGMVLLSGKVQEMKKDYVQRLKSGTMKMTR